MTLRSLLYLLSFTRISNVDLCKIFKLKFLIMVQVLLDMISFKVMFFKHHLPLFSNWSSLKSSLHPTG